jgi:hypothetical protein
MLTVPRNKPDNLPGHLSLKSRQKTEILFCSYQPVITVHRRRWYWTHLSSSLTVYARQFRFSPFATTSAELLIPHTNEYVCKERISM